MTELRPDDAVPDFCSASVPLLTNVQVVEVSGGGDQPLIEKETKTHVTGRTCVLSEDARRGRRSIRQPSEISG